MSPSFRLIPVLPLLLAASGCTFILGKPQPQLHSDPAPTEKLTPILIYIPDCDYEQKLDKVGLIGARQAYPAMYAAESICKAVNAELPGALDAAGIESRRIVRRQKDKEAAPPEMARDAAELGVHYALVLRQPLGFDGAGQHAPTVTMNLRLYRADSGEYRGLAQADYGISLRDYSQRGPSADARRIAAEFSTTMARTLLERCTEDYFWQCGKHDRLRFTVPREGQGK